MPRIVGIEMPDNKLIVFALAKIYGVGIPRAWRLVKQTKINPQSRVKDIEEQDLLRLTHLIENNFKVEGELRMEVRENIRRLKAIGTYRGIRHKRQLPVRGQRTRRNARTAKGRKKMAIGGLSAKKKAAKAKT